MFVEVRLCCASLQCAASVNPQRANENSQWLHLFSSHIGHRAVTLNCCYLLLRRRQFRHMPTRILSSCTDTAQSPQCQWKKSAYIQAVFICLEDLLANVATGGRPDRKTLLDLQSLCDWESVSSFCKAWMSWFWWMKLLKVIIKQHKSA